MAKKYLKNNPQSTAFFDADESGLNIVNQNPVEVDFHPARHKRLSEAISSGRVIEITEAEFKAFYSEDTKKTKKVIEAPKVEETTEPVEEPAATEEVSPLLNLTKEELIIWAEEQTFITEADLEEAKKLKKTKELRAYLQDLLDLEGK